jgi:hypothetical protein
MVYDRRLGDLRERANTLRQTIQHAEEVRQRNSDEIPRMREAVRRLEDESFRAERFIQSNRGRLAQMVQEIRARERDAQRMSKDAAELANFRQVESTMMGRGYRPSRPRGPIGCRECGRQFNSGAQLAAHETLTGHTN